MTSPLKIGISGAGVIGRVHANALSRLENGQLVAVAEPRIEAGKAFAEEFGVRHYADFPDLLENDEVDVVIVTTPSGLHPDQTVLACQAGKHVITEKPMAITREGLDRMIGAAYEANVKLGVIFQNRLSRDVVVTKRAIEQGAIGTPVLANGAMYWHRTQEYYDANGGWRGTWALDGGGALMNQAIHTIDILQWCMDGVREAKAFTSTLGHQIETEDVASATFLYNNGALGTMTATTCAPTDMPIRIEFVGSGGRITLENNVVTSWESDMSQEEVTLTSDDERLVHNWTADERFGDGHTRQLDVMLDAIAAGEQPYVPGTEARAAVDIILRIYDDATGRHADE